jgi:hypothetical protein
LVRLADGSVQLIWHGRRHRVREPGVVLAALGWGTERPVPVAPALLSALAAGADLGRIAIAGRGERSTAVPGARVGDVFVTGSQGGGRQYAVALRDGLAVVSQVQADLLIGDPLGRQTDAIPLGAGEYARLAKAPFGAAAGADALPAETPRLARVADGRSVCALLPDGAEPELRLDVGIAVPPAAVRTGGSPGSVDWVAVDPGGGAVVGDPSGELCVVTDQAIRYAVPQPDVLAVLGLGAVRPVRLPAAVLNLLPAGPVLDPATARSPAS